MGQDQHYWIEGELRYQREQELKALKEENAKFRTALANLVTSIENDDCEVSCSAYFHLEQARAVLKGARVTR